MNRMDLSTDDGGVALHELPDELPDGSSILVAKPASLSDYALTLRVSDRYADPDDCRLILTTAVGAARTIDQHESVVTGSAERRFGVVDASDGHQPSAPFQEHPTVSLPNPSELTRIVLALQQLESTLSKDCATINVVVRSLSPILEGTRLEPVTRVVEQLIDRQRAAGGIAVFGLEYTRHDNRTMTALRDRVDAVVWVEDTPSGLHLECEGVRRR